MIKEMIWEVYTVRNKKPPFEITEAALSEVMEISELARIASERFILLWLSSRTHSLWSR